MAGEIPRGLLIKAFQMKITGFHIKEILKARPYTGSLAIITIIAVLSISMFLFSYNKWIAEVNRQIDSQNRQTLIQTVSLARNAISPYIKDFQTNKITREEALSDIRNLVRNMTYKDQYGVNYIFMGAYDGVMLVQSYEPDMEMTNQWNLRDNTGKYFVREFIKTAQENPLGSFVNYNYYFPGKYKKTQNKLAYILGIPELNCYLGTGMYTQLAIYKQHDILMKTHIWVVVFIFFLICLAIAAVVATIKSKRSLAAESAARKRNESALKISEIQYSEVVENVRSIVLRLDKKGTILYINEFGEKLFGYSHGELDGKNVIDTIVPSVETSGRDTKTLVKDTLTDPEMYSTNINENIAKDGRRFWILWKNRPVYNDNGKLREIMSIGSDITEIRTAEIAVRESEETLKLIFEYSGDGIILSSSDGSILSVNKEACRILDRTEEELVKLKRLDVFDSTDSRLSAALEERERTGKFTGELNMLKKDGTPFPCEISSIIFTDPQGHLRASTFIRDITKRKAIEAALLKSEEKYRTLVNNANETIIVIQEGKIKFYNKILFDYTDGYTPEDLIDKNFIDFVYSKDKELVARNYSLRINNEPVSPKYEFRIISRDREVKWVELSGVRIIWEGEPATLNFLNDITERKAAEIAIRESEEKYRLIVENQNDMVVKTDVNGNSLYVSPSYCEMFGKTEKELLGNVYRPTTHEDDLPVIEKALELLHTPPYTTYYEGRALTAHGWKWLGWSIKALMDENDNCTAFVSTGRVITKRKEMEAALIKSEEKYRNIIDNANETIVVVRNGLIKFFNKKIITLANGYTFGDFFNKALTDFVHPDDKDMVEDYYRRRISGESAPSRYEVRLLTIDGTTKWIEVSVVTIMWEEELSTLNFLTDITERKLAEETLRKNETLLAAGAMAAHLGSWEIDIKKREATVSDEWQKIHGCTFNTSPLSVLGQLLHPEDRERVVNAFEKTYSTSELFEIEHRIIRMDNGEVRHIRIYGEKIFDSDGVPVKMYLASLDITKQKLTEEALEKSETHLQRIAAVLKDAFYSVEGEPREFTYLSPSFEKLLGYTDDDIRVMGGREAFLKQVMAEGEFEKQQNVLDGKDYNTNETGFREWSSWWKRKDGTMIYIEDNFIKIYENGKFKNAFGVLRDVTARKLAEDALTEWQSLMDYIIRHNPNSIEVYDKDLNYIYVSDRYRTDFGIGEKDIIGKNLLEVFPEIPDKWMAVNRRVLEGIVERSEEDIFVRKNGKVEYTRWECRPWYKFDGEIGGMIAYTEFITERKLAEGALRESRRKLETLMSNLPGMAYRCRNDKNWTMEYISSGCLALSGYLPDDLIENKKLSFNDLVLENYREPLWNKWQAALAEKTSFLWEYPIIIADGSEKWVWEQGCGIYNEDGEVIALEGFISDITERKHAEEALHESREHLKLITDSIPALIVHVNKDRRYNFVNKHLGEFFNFKEEDILGKHIKDVVGDEVYSEISPYIDKVLSGVTSEYFRNTLTLDGKEIFIHTIMEPDFGPDGEIRGYFALARDITEMRKAEQALRESEARQRSILNGAPMGIGIIKNRILIEVNNKICDITGYPREELIGDSTLKLYATVEDFEYIGREYRQAEESGTGYAESQWKTKDGIIKDVLLGLTSIDLSDLSKGFTFTVIDITERKKSENALRDSEARHKSILKGAPIGIGIVQNRIITEANDRFCAITGYSREELVGDSSFKLYATVEDYEVVGKETYKQAAEFGTGVIETHWKTKNGIHKDILLGLTPLDQSDFSRGFTFTVLDITERKKSENALRDSEARQRSILRATPVGIGLAINRVILEMNDSFCEITGYSREELTGQNTRFLYPTDELYNYIGTFLYAKAVEKGVGVTETQFKTKNGQIIDIIMNLNPLDQSDLSKGVIFTILDITNRKQAEETLRKKTAELDSYFNNSLDLLCIANTEGYFLKLNHEWETKLGYSLSELIGKKFVDFIHPDDIDYTLEALSKLSHQEKVTGLINRYRRFDGSYRWIEWNSFPEGDTIYAVARDITDNRLNEEKIRNQMEFLNTLIDTIPNPIFYKDINGIYLGVNKAYMEFTGKSASDVIGKTVFEFEPPEIALKYETADKELLDGAKNQSYEFTVKNKDGVEKSLIINKAIFRDSFGDVAGIIGIGIDISSRKKMEEALRESENLFRLLADNTLDMVALHNIDGSMTYISPSVEKILGYKPEEIKGTSPYYLFHPEDIEGVWHNVHEKVIHGEINFRYEYRIRNKKTGEYVWVETNSSPIKNDLGEIVGIQASTRNINDRKTTEKALRESEKMFRLLADNTLDIVAIHKTDGSISYISPAVEKILGYTSEELIGTDPYLLFHPDDIEGVRENIQEKALRGEENYRFDYRIRKKSGEYVWHETSSSPIKNDNGEVVGIQATSRDINARKLAEDALRESEKMFRLLADNTLDIVAIHKTDGSISYISPAVEKILGYKPEELIGTNPLDFYHPDDIEGVRRNINEKVKKGEENTSYQFRIRNKKGEFIWLESSNTPIKNENGEIVGIQASSRDVTIRKLAETALRESEARFRTVIETLPLGLWLADTNGNLLMVNKAGLNIWAVSKLGEKESDEFNGWRLPGHEKILPEEWPIVRAAKEGKISSAELLEIEDLNGVHKYILSWAAPILNEAGEITGAFLINQDVTEQTKAQEALKESEEKWRAYVEKSPVSIFMVDDNGKIVEVNPAASKLLGYSESEFPGKPVSEIFAPDVEDTGMNHYRRSMETGYAEGIVPMRDINGETHHVMAMAARISNTRVIAFCQDMTDKIKAEEALRETEEIFTQFMEHSPIYVFFKDENIRSLRLSRNYETMLGRPLEELMNKNMFELFPSEFAKNIVADDIHILKEGKQITIDEELNGRYYTTIKFPIIIEGKSTYLAGYTIDITDRKLAEEKIIDQMEFLSTLIDTIPNPIYYKDLNGIYLGANRAFLEFLGKKKEDVIGKTISDIVSTDLAGKYIAKDRELFTNPGNQVFEWMVTAYDGTRKIMMFSRATFRDSYGNIAGIIGIMLDISDRKKMEEERLELERRLLHSQKLESLVVLAGGIAHDFNNLLMAILGNLDLALMEISPDSPIKPSIEEAMTASKRAADLTQQMLAYSGKGHFVISEIDLTSLVEENASIFRASLSKTVTLNLRLEKNLPLIKADIGQIQQVVMNLITNASDAIGDKPGVATISTGVMDCDEEYLSNSRVDEKPKPGKFIFIEVSDTGIGMTNETIQRLFDPFFTTKFTGRGLGMSAVLGIIRGHNGAIMVYSEPAQGTTIKALFPALAGVTAQKAVKLSEPLPGLLTPEENARKHLVLVVDDEEGVLLFCRKALGIFGYRTLSASDGIEAMNVYKAHSAEIDCVLMDLTMPKMDGASTIDALWEINPELKIILSSGFSEQEATRRFAGKNLAGFIQKPYDLKRLRETLEKAFRD